VSSHASTGSNDANPDYSSDSDSESEDDEREAVMGSLQRDVPKFWEQVVIIITRNLIMWWRKMESRLIFFGVMIGGAVLLACQDWEVKTPKWDAMSFVNCQTCVALLLSIYSLNTFGKDQPIFWRERNRGLNVLSFTSTRMQLDMVDLFMMCMLFVAVYYVIRGIELGFFMYAVPFLFVAYVAAGWGYAVSAWLPAQHGAFITTLIVFISCGLLGNPMNLQTFLHSPWLEFTTSVLSITRWSIPMSFLKYVEVVKPDIKHADMQDQLTFGVYQSALTAGHWQKSAGYWWGGMYALLLQGLALRLIAYLGLVFKNRDKQV